MKSKLPKGVEITESGALRIWFMLKGQRVREPIGLSYSVPNAKVAERLRNKVVEAIDRGTFTFAEFFPDSKRASEHVDGKTFKEIAELWFKSKLQEGVKRNTQIKYRQLLDQFWLPRYGALPIASFKAAKVKMDLLEDEVLAEASAVRYNDALIPLRGTFELAVDLELLEANPAARLVNRSRGPTEPDPFEAGEVRAIIRSADKLFGTVMADYFTVAFLTGLRPSEQIALLKEDIDLDRDRVLVARSLNAGEVEAPKSRAGRRHVEIIKPVREAFERMLAIGPKREHVFYHPELLQPFSEARPVREVYWERAVKEAGVRYRTLYQTRHTFATQALMARAHPMWVAGQMGHEDTKLVFSTYSKWLPDQLENRESRKIEVAIGGTLQVEV
ncbi:DUF3596 domain-containing protein [Variovorax paradoxus]|nr:DUF3596 domain-containing protein [Variovorax paradoxus]